MSNYQYILDPRFLLLCVGYLSVNIWGAFEESQSDILGKYCSVNVTKPFLCSLNGPCIHINKRCDNHTDCPGGEDERKCQAYHECENRFSCDNEMGCLPWSNVCDGREDCWDKTDESPVSCNEKRLRLLDYACHKDDFLCPNSTLCINNKSLCDGHNDCHDGADEDDTICHFIIHPKVDTGTGSQSCLDEESIREACHGDNDCYDQHMGNCTDNLCNINNGGCDHKCVSDSQSHQYHCECRVGYRIDPHNMHHCIDEDECAEWGTCSQLCYNTVGSYQCHCRPHYQYNEVLKTCEPRVHSPLALLYQTDQQLRIYIPQTEEDSQVVYQAPHGATIHDFVHHINDHRLLTIYLVENLPNGHDCIIAVYYHTKDGYKTHKTRVRTLLQLPYDQSVRLLSFDHIHERLYWITKEGLFVMDPSETVWWSRIVENPSLGSGLLAVPQMKKIYFFNFGENKLYRADLDGLNLEKVTDAPQAEYLRHLTWDYSLEQLAWLDSNKEWIYSYDPVKNNMHTFKLSPISWVYLNGFAIFGDQYYWSNAMDDVIRSISKFSPLNDTKPSTFVFIKRYNTKKEARDFHLIHPYNQPRGNNVCSMHKCQQLCLPTLSANNFYPRCLCSHGFQLNTSNHQYLCQPSSLDSNRTTNQLQIQQAQSITNSFTKSTATILGYLLTAVVVLFLIYVCIRWRLASPLNMHKKTPIHFSIESKGAHFLNPIYEPLTSVAVFGSLPKPHEYSHPLKCEAINVVTGEQSIYANQELCNEEESNPNKNIQMDYPVLV